MKLLVLTQKVDKNDPILGFFHTWISRLSERFEKISVVCLEKPARHASQGEAGGGEYNFPQNVKVFSLGKDRDSYSVLHNSIGKKIKYTLNFWKLIWQTRDDYDTVFVHMNQEYVILGGLLWKILGKKIYFWRNHPNGSFLTRIAVLLSDKVFYTSHYSFTARFKKGIKMPVGIDTDVFKNESRSTSYEILRNKILFLGRMSPIKKPDLLIEALYILDKQNVDFVCDFYGDPLPKDINYYEKLKNRVKELNLEKKVSFFAGMPNSETSKIYKDHNIFINLTPTGSMDKTILEAVLCGCIPVVSNKYFDGIFDKNMITFDEVSDLSNKINFWLKEEESEIEKISKKLSDYVVKNHSLTGLIRSLCLILLFDEK